MSLNTKPHPQSGFAGISKDSIVVADEGGIHLASAWRMTGYPDRGWRIDLCGRQAIEPRDVRLLIAALSLALGYVEDSES